MQDSVSQSASALTSGKAFPIATLVPAAFSMGRSLYASPIAIVSAMGISSFAASAVSADAFETPFTTISTSRSAERVTPMCAPNASRSICARASLTARPSVTRSSLQFPVTYASIPSLPTALPVIFCESS